MKLFQKSTTFNKYFNNLLKLLIEIGYNADKIDA